MNARCLSTAFLLAMGAPGAAQAKVNVVTTTQDPAAIARAIGGDRVEVTALAKGYQDPHYLEAKPSYVLSLHRADLAVVVGLDLEVGYLSALLSGARNGRILPGQQGFLDLSTVIAPLEVAPLVDRSHGDIHPQGNPHYWLDPENGRRMARALAARLSALEPTGRATYTGNLAAFEKQLDAKMIEWRRRMAPLAGRPVVTYHRSWSYFAARFGLEVVAYVEPKPGIPPTAAHTLEVIRLAQSRRVPLILMESFYDKRVPTLIAEKSGARLAAIPISVGGEPGIETYVDLFDRILDTIARELRE